MSVTEALPDLATRRINPMFSSPADRRAMDPMQPALLRLAERRLAWLDRRQQVLAENVANADTPGWTPRDLAPFAQALADHTVTLARTEPGHLRGTVPSVPLSEQTVPEARAPDGNAVALDRQLSAVADTTTSQELVTSLYKKYLGMFSLALGYGG